MLHTLPPDVALLTTHFLLTSDAFVAAQVCKAFHSLLNQAPWLWRTCRLDSNALSWSVGCSGGTRMKRRRHVVNVPDVLHFKGSTLHSLTLGCKSATAESCNLVEPEWIELIARACPQLRKLKLFFEDTALHVSTATLNALADKCPQLTTLAVPINTACVFGNEPSRLRVSSLRLHGYLTYPAFSHTRFWLGEHIHTLKFCDVNNLGDLTFITQCVNLRHLLLHNCAAPEEGEDDARHHDHDDHVWLFSLSHQLHTLGIVNSDVLCLPFLLTTFVMDAEAVWANLRSLWFDRESVHNFTNTELVQYFACCSDIKCYHMWRHGTVDQFVRCAKCRQKKLPLLDEICVS